MKKNPRFLLVIVLLFSAMALAAQVKKADLSFTVSIKDPTAHFYHVEFRCEGLDQPVPEFRLPNWTPGYYQLMNYAANVFNFTAADADNREIAWEKTTPNGWKLTTGKKRFRISYDVKAENPFVAALFLNEERGYISPAGLFIYPVGMIRNPVTIHIQPYEKWSSVATGLEPVAGKPNTFFASDYDVLFDSPILMGNLESFPSFTVKGIPHHFTAYKAGSFDKTQFMADLQKIVSAASGIIGDIPYTHYTFLGIGPGAGGIEHLNSASVSFSGEALNTAPGRARIYNFLAHEYFHHYNVKRIRPIELGPFDYDNGSRTKMLWLSEGLTVYYEYLVVKRAGLKTEAELLKEFQVSIKAYETKPGRQFQTPAEASWKTWDEGPFGRTDDEVNKTISPYDKGPLLGMLLDFRIRHETKNKASLDDLMRRLYHTYYKKLGRGFTEDEFRREAEKIAGTSLEDFFDYIYTLKPINYSRYFGYAGLSIDTVSNELPGGWLGIAVRDRNDSLIITNCDWQSPAWNSGLRRRYTVLQVNGNRMNAKAFTELVTASRPGDKITIRFTTATGSKEEEIVLGVKKEASFEIRQVDKPTDLQKNMLRSWMGG